jgi:hypothetical protein
MNYEDILINGLLLFISYKVILGSYETIKYLFIISILLILYFRGLRSGGFFYRQFLQNENEPDIYIIRPLKEYF